jgi:hypothetical protein
MRWFRVIAVWILLMSVEVVQGIARTLFLAPVVGDFRARQLAVVSGSLLIVSIASGSIASFSAPTRGAALPAA